MALIVQKFGGTSVGSAERIRNVARRVAKWKAAGHDLVVVPSAMAGETNRLIALAKAVQAQPDPRELDVLASTGEQVTIGLLCMALMELGVRAKSYTGWQVRVTTDSAFTKSRIVEIDDGDLTPLCESRCGPRSTARASPGSSAWGRTRNARRGSCAARRSSRLSAGRAPARP